MATKPFVTVTLTLHGGDNPVEVADYIDDNGIFVNLGTQVAGMLSRHDQIHFVDADGIEVIIPYDSILASDVAKVTDEYTPAEDEYCVDVDTERKSYTVSFYNGEDPIWTTIVDEGAVPVYRGITPRKEGYIFLGWNTDPTAETPLEPLPPVDAATTYYAIFGEEQSEAVVGTAIVGTSQVG